MRKPRLTLRQLRALAIIEEFAALRGAGPTLRELADGLELAAQSAALRHVSDLSRQGFVTVDRKGEQMRAAARTLRPTDRGRRLLVHWEQFQSTGNLRGERELVLSGEEWARAKKLDLPVRAYWVRTEGDAAVLTFRNSHERAAWLAALLGKTEK